MKIDAKRGIGRGSTEVRRSKLLHILEQPPLQVQRPCVECGRRCAAHHSTSCACECSPRCEDASKQLSSAPERYPIEPLILPLVMELAALRVCQPCWSCEGHASAEGTLLKLPSVWFYVDDITVVDLLARFLASARSSLKLSTVWHVVVAYGVNDIAFACTPNAWGLPTHLTLRSLQQDAYRLSEGLRSGFHREAQRDLAASNGG